MHTTGHTSTHERSFTLMQGSAMMYVIPALQWIHGRTANIVDWGPLESSPARALGCLTGDRCSRAPRQKRTRRRRKGQRLRTAGRAAGTARVERRRDGVDVRCLQPTSAATTGTVALDRLSRVA